MDIRTNYTLIVTLSKNWKFQENTKLWHLNEGLDYMLSLIQPDSIVALGRNTFEALGSKPIKNSSTIVLSKDEKFSAQGCFVVSSMGEISGGFTSKYGPKRRYILGGYDLFKHFIPKALTLELFLMDYDVEEGGIDFFHLNDGWMEWRVKDIDLWNGRKGKHITYKFFHDMVTI